MKRLFAVTHATQRAALAPAESAVWYSVEAARRDHALGPDSAHPWDVAHGALRGGLGVDGGRVLAAEPDLEQGWRCAGEGDGRDLGVAAAPRDPCAAPRGEKGDPFETGGTFGWHLDAQHSGLKAARDLVGDAAKTITIVHLDTGYDADHLALPVNLAKEAEQRNFVEGGNSAIDRTPAGWPLDNRGHGTGTLGILAGGDVKGLNPGGGIPKSFGALGGAPSARVVPVRIANSVVHFWTGAVAQGIDYAREIGADVVSMSMGGVPSEAWADAVNAAYEAGVVVVCAAGNSFGGFPTSLIVYPARFNRVIAACGVMAKDKPYYGLGGKMEGCIGPPSKMATAIAAFTPNIPWLRLGCTEIVDMDGAGTSAATPQVAAAAALWLAKNGGKYAARDWRRVEAVRKALFDTANSTVGGPERSLYFGRGLLRANAAVTHADVGALEKTKPDSASFGFLHLLTGAFGLTARPPHELAMLRLELTQLALSSQGFREAIPDPTDPNLSADKLSSIAVRRALTAILDERKSSIALRDYLGDMLGSLGGAPAGPALRPPAQTGAVRREIKIPMPTRRRVRIFATDPGDASKLELSFLNVATIEVPWENVDPGPVGEYLEVVDVDPASDAVYPPVDLGDRHLLAQDGLAPSEGNPQFHQQMVYAVAMRTIRNFEIALGRRALWSPRRRPKDEPTTDRRRPKDKKPFVPAPDGGYVQRLRIYPHALREKNAYYTSERKALLFGYFDADAGARKQTVFTCLSHDIVAHETTHALLDGLHRRFQEPTNEDVLAFHEAFADIVAIFQHFTFPELLRFEIARLRGDLSHDSILSDLARQFGQSLHNGRALRRAFSPVPSEKRGSRSGAAEPPDPEGPETPLNYRDAKEPHERGAILVAAVFDAFLSIYNRRTKDLFRLATGGSGVLQAGAIHPDLVERLAQTAVDTAQRVLTTAIRALDYMPPVDPNFGDYLRAIVTADADLAPDHGVGYRVAFAEAFARRGIYPEGIPSVSPDGLLWNGSYGPVQSARFNTFIQEELDLGLYTQSDRRKAFESEK